MTSHLIMLKLRLATFNEIDRIWEILQQAITQRKAEGSLQWQDGYPNPKIIENDIRNGYGYVLDENGSVIAYAAIVFGVEPAYTDIEGKWITNGDYCVVHRVATHNSVKGRGLGTKIFQMIEDLVKSKNVHSIKVDTNFDNKIMLHLLEKLNYVYCGEINYDGDYRKAFEKVLE